MLAEWHGSRCPPSDFARWVRVVCPVLYESTTAVLIHAYHTEKHPVRANVQGALRLTALAPSDTSRAPHAHHRRAPIASPPTLRPDGTHVYSIH